MFQKCLRCIRNGGDIIIIFQNWPNFVKYKITDGTTQCWCSTLHLNHNSGPKMFPFGTGWWWGCMCRELRGGVVPLLCSLPAFLSRESGVKVYTFPVPSVWSSQSANFKPLGVFVCWRIGSVTSKLKLGLDMDNTLDSRTQSRVIVTSHSCAFLLKHQESVAKV